MGWIRDAVEDIFDWLYESIVEPVIDWIKDAIEEIRVNIRNFLHTAKGVLAEWLQNDWFFLLFAAAIIAAIFFAPQIMTWLQETGLYKAVSTFAKTVVDGVVKLINLQAYINLKLVDDLLKTFVDNYREARQGLTDSLAGLAADLGHGTGFLNAVVESSRGIYVGTAAILGLDPRLTEIQWYNETAAFTKKINDRFYHYARDPSAAYYDFFTEVLLPRATELQGVQQKELDQIRDNFNRLLEIEGGLKLLRDSVEQFIEALPNRIEEQFNARWDEISPVIDDLISTLSDDIIPRFNMAVDAIEQAQKMQEQVNAQVRSRMNDPNDMLFRWSDYDQQEKDVALEGLARMITNGESDTASLRDPESAAWQRRLDELTNGAYKDVRSKAFLGLEAPFSGRVRGERTVSIPSPFVGEY